MADRRSSPWPRAVTLAVSVCDSATRATRRALAPLESSIGWLLAAPALLIELVQTLPALGALLRWSLNLLTLVLHAILAAPDALLGLVGIRPEKVLRVHAVILRDESGAPVATREFARQALSLAADVYLRDANIRLVPPTSSHRHGKGSASASHDDWIRVAPRPASRATLDAPCGVGAIVAEWWRAGSAFQWLTTASNPLGAWRRVTGYGGPLACFIIRSIPDAAGCSPWITHYVTIRGELTRAPGDPDFRPPRSLRTLGHEVAHTCNLWHTCSTLDPRNLMSKSDACSPPGPPPDRSDPVISRWQSIVLRASKHVTYL